MAMEPARIVIASLFFALASYVVGSAFFPRWPSLKWGNRFYGDPGVRMSATGKLAVGFTLLSAAGAVLMPNCWNILMLAFVCGLGLIALSGIFDAYIR
jgi:hypothetical protein